MDTHQKQKDVPGIFCEHLVLSRYLLNILGINSGNFKKDSMASKTVHGANSTEKWLAI